MSRQLTVATVGELDFRSVIYMEITVPGGMGNAGGVVLEVFDGACLVRYETNCQSDQAAWDAAQDKVKAHRVLFNYHYGGYGNDVYLNRAAGICIDEPNAQFSCELAGNRYGFASSVPGVFMRVVASIGRAAGS